MTSRAPLACRTLSAKPPLQVCHSGSSGGGDKCGGDIGVANLVGTDLYGL